MENVLIEARKGKPTLRPQAHAKVGSQPPSDAPATETTVGRSAIDLVLDSVENAKAEEIVSIDMAGKSAIADHMVVVSGRSHRHVTAVAEHLIRDLKNAGVGQVKVEGLQNGDWVLIDTGDIIVHIFRPEIRSVYNLEKMWTVGDGSDSTLH